MNPEWQPATTGADGEQRQKIARPRAVTILALGVLIIAVFFWTRLYQAVRWWAFIESLDLSVSPAYLFLTGLVFGTAGLPAAWGLWRGDAWAPGAARRFFTALAAYYWLDFAFFTVSDSARGSWPFNLALTVLALAWVFWVLSRPKITAFFSGKAEHRPPPNPFRTGSGTNGEFNDE